MNTLPKATKKNLAIGVLTLGLVVTSGLTMVSAAYDDDHDEHHRGPQFMQSEEVQQIIAAKDFSAWQNLDLPDRLEDLSEEEFEQFTEMVTLHQAGDHEGAKEIHEALGLPEHKGHGKHQRAHRPNAEDLIYETWAEHMAEKEINAQFITEDTFHEFKAAVELAQDGNREALEALRDKLDLPERSAHRGAKRAGKILEVSYDEWAEKAAARGMDDAQITEATFTTLQKAATLFESGDREAAKALLDEAGIQRPQKHMRKSQDERPEQGQQQGERRPGQGRFFHAPAQN